MGVLKWSVVILCLFSCESMTQKETALASAYGRTLHLEDLSEELLRASSTRDSNAIISKAVDEWVMSEILLHEAKNRIGSEERISRMVQDYEKELYLHQLDKFLLSEQLDTTLTTAELDTFISRSGDKRTLQEGMVRLLLVKVQKTDNMNEMDELWKTEDLPGLKVKAKQQKGMALLDPNRWYTTSEIKSLLPAELIEELSFSKANSEKKSIGEKKFYVKILEAEKKGSPVPLALQRSEVRQKLLQVKSKELLNQWKNDLYQNKIKSKDIILEKMDAQSSQN